MIKAGFDLVAPFYDALTYLVFGNSTRQAQLPFVRNIPVGATILIIGGGTGWLLKEIYRSVTTGHILYLEASEKMLELSRKKLGIYPLPPNIEFRLGTEKNISPEEKFDFIISPFLFDLFPPTELSQLCHTLKKSLNAGGQWQVTDFVAPKGQGFRYFTQKILLKLMYFFFRVVSNIPATKLPDWEKTMAALGLILQESVYFYRGMIKSVLYRHF